MVVSAYKGWSKNVGDLQGLLDPGESPLGVCAHRMLFPRPRTRGLSVFLGRQTTHTILIFYPNPEGDQERRHRTQTAVCCNLFLRRGERILWLSGSRAWIEGTESVSLWGSQGLCVLMFLVRVPMGLS